MQEGETNYHKPEDWVLKALRGSPSCVTSGPEVCE